jgi:tetratricopeptide (TPR) repeat protein
MSARPPTLRFLAASAVLGLLAFGCGDGAHANGVNPPGIDPAGAGSPGAESGGEADRLKRVLAESQYLADLGAVHLNHGKVDAAIASYRQAVAAGQGVNENALHLWALGRAYKAKGDDASWRSSLEHAARLFAKFVTEKERAQLKDYYFEQLAMLHGELGDPTKAVEWIDQMASEGQPDQATFRAKARLYMAAGLGAKALAVLEQAERDAPPGIDADRASYAVAEVLVTMRKLDEATARLRALMAGAAEPGLRAEAKRLLFRVYDATGKLDELDLGGKAPAGATPAGGKR